MQHHRISRHGWVVFLVLLAASCGCVCHGHPGSEALVKAMQPLQGPAVVEAQLEEPHLIDVGDLVNVKFPYKPDFNQSTTVRDDGMIVLPFIGPILAAGRTPEVLQNEINTYYASIAYDPIADREASAHRQYLINAGDVLDIRFDFASEFDERVTVRPDGKISLARVRTVQAEGRTAEELGADLMERYKNAGVKESSLVVIVRTPTSDLVYVDGEPQRLGLKDLDSATVLVQRAVPNQFYITGEVEHPGAFPYRVPMTAMRAIALAGGYKRTAKLSSVIVLRKVGADSPVAIKVNLRPEIKGTATTDLTLRPYDVVLVPKTEIAKLQDVVDQYLYNLIPATKPVTFFTFNTSLSPSGSVSFSTPAGSTGR
jgi:polysaccharide export outer membrane protein